MMIERMFVGVRRRQKLFLGARHGKSKKNNLLGQVCAAKLAERRTARGMPRSCERGCKVAGSTADLYQAGDTPVSCRRYRSIMPMILQCQAVILQCHAEILHRECFSMLPNALRGHVVGFLLCRQRKKKRLQAW